MNNEFAHIQDFFLQKAEQDSGDLLLHQYQDLHLEQKAFLIYGRLLELLNHDKAITSTNEAIAITLESRCVGIANHENDYFSRLIQFDEAKCLRFHKSFWQDWGHLIKQDKYTVSIWNLFLNPHYEPPLLPDIIDHLFAMTVFYRSMPEYGLISLKTYSSIEFTLLRLIEKVAEILATASSYMPTHERYKIHAEILKSQKDDRKNHVVNSFISWMDDEGSVLIKNGIPLTTAVKAFKKAEGIKQDRQTIISYLEDSQELLRQHGIILPE